MGRIRPCKCGRLRLNVADFSNAAAGCFGDQRAPVLGTTPHLLACYRARQANEQHSRELRSHKPSRLTKTRCRYDTSSHYETAENSDLQSVQWDWRVEAWVPRM